MTEREIQTLSIAALRKFGFTCCVTSNRKKTSNTKGTPDAFVHIKNGMWVALEFKGPTGKSSKEQFNLSEKGMSFTVNSLEKAIHICLILKLKKFKL